MRVDWCVSSWFRIKNTHSLTHGRVACLNGLVRGACQPHSSKRRFASQRVCVSRALRGGSGKEEPLPKSTTLGAPPLPPRALQAAPGNDGLPPTQPPLGTPGSQCVTARTR